MPAPQPKFSIRIFLLQTGLQFGVLLLGIRLLAPEFWNRQLAAGPLAFLTVFLTANLCLAFFEWAFHRYLLHGVIIQRLGILASTHRNHHSLTSVRLERVPGTSDRIVLNRYPITSEEQYEDAAFPVYALAVFWLLFSPILVAAQLLWPGSPAILAGLTAITWSVSAYEVIHAIDHWPYEWWKNATEHPRFGNIWKRIYGFHHYHHAHTGRNMAISGFILGIPLADFVLGTYHQPAELLLEGRLATARDFAAPEPVRMVRWMDAWARRRGARLESRKSESLV